MAGAPRPQRLSTGAVLPQSTTPSPPEPAKSLAFEALEAIWRRERETPPFRLILVFAAFFGPPPEPFVPPSWTTARPSTASSARDASASLDEGGRIDRITFGRTAPGGYRVAVAVPVAGVGNPAGTTGRMTRAEGRPTTRRHGRRRRRRGRHQQVARPGRPRAHSRGRGSCSTRCQDDQPSSPCSRQRLASGDTRESCRPARRVGDPDGTDGLGGNRPAMRVRRGAGKVNDGDAGEARSPGRGVAVTLEANAMARATPLKRVTKAAYQGCRLRHKNEKSRSPSKDAAATIKRGQRRFRGGLMERDLRALGVANTSYSWPKLRPAPATPVSSRSRRRPVSHVVRQGGTGPPRGCSPARDRRSASRPSECAPDKRNPAQVWLDLAGLKR